VTTASNEALHVTEISRRPGPISRAVAVWRYRELLANLTRKELKVKYKNSALGFAWSLLNPILYLVVYWFVFQVVLKAGIPNFAIFFLAGLLPWNFFSTALGGGTISIVGNRGLVSKVWFPREILPLASIGAAMVHFFLQSLVLALTLVVFRYAPSPQFMLLLIPALVTLVVFLAALAIALSAVNVYLRDTQHFLELVLLAWFWLTPIVYAYETAKDQLGAWSWVFLANPMTDIVLVFQRAIYNKTWYFAPDPVTGRNTVLTRIIPDASLWWYFRNLAIVFVISAVLLWGALWLFGRLEDNIAEEV
jgi:ABC-2 type transport system permease protein